jgi:hypothetical protein
VKLREENDGKLFINVYSQARTQLGRDLSNFAHTPFTHKKYGEFNSVEGAYYYFYTGRRFEKLRKLSGAWAKSEGLSLIPNEWRNQNAEIDDEFKKIIRECIQCKLRENKNILWVLISTDLPLEHFYVKGERIINKTKHKWILDEIDRIRKVTQKWYIEKYKELPNIEINILK